MYIYQRQNWTNFRWGKDIEALLAAVRHRQGLLLGTMQGLGFQLQEEATLQTITQDVVKSSDIEGEVLDAQQVRSSIARRLGIDIGHVVSADRNVEGVVEMMLDATQNHGAELSKKRLFGWHSALFPGGYSGIHKIRVAGWRKDESGPMQVVSGAIGREKVHYEAPPATKLPRMMGAFLRWYNADGTLDPVLKAAIAHFWFVTIHPFEDGNGRIARAIADMSLARSDRSSLRFYSMSAQIRAERKEYYEKLERAQKGTSDITDWLAWFLGCLDRSFDHAERSLENVLAKSRFWQRHAGAQLNERQKHMVNRLLDSFVGKLTSSKWAKINKCSQDTAGRDIASLVALGVLKKDGAGGRSTSYSLVLEGG